MTKFARFSLILSFLLGGTIILADDDFRGRVITETFDGGPCLTDGSYDKCFERALFIDLCSRSEILSIEFYAHDNFGSRTDGKIDVHVGRQRVASRIDIKSRGRWHRINLRGRHVFGGRIRFTAQRDDVQIETVRVRYIPDYIDY